MISRASACLLAICAWGLFPGTAMAGFYSGDELFKVCTADRSSPSYLDKTYECVAYIAGAVDAFNTTRTANKLKSCIPAGVTISQLKDATVDFLNDNQAGLNGSASTLVFAATRKTWPCPKRK